MIEHCGIDLYHFFQQTHEAWKSPKNFKYMYLA